MKQQHTLQPKVRFPEFEGDWESITLNDISEIKSGGTPSRTNPKFWNGDIPWITTSLVDYNDIINSEEYITIEAVENSSAKIFPINTILMAMYGQGNTRGRVSKLKIEATTNQACAAIIVNQERDYNFIYQILVKSYDDLRNLSNEGGQKNLSLGIIKDFHIKLPSLPEQQKIADYLSTIDTKINLLEEKKAQLALYKKAMMQKLFNQEIRFKPTQCHTELVEVEIDEVGAVEAYPEWEEKRLGEVISLKGGYAFKSDLFKENGVPIMRISNISNNNIYIDENNMVYYDDFKISDSYKVFTGELLIALSGATTGKASIYNLKNFSYVNQRVGVFKSINKCYYNFIVQYIFSSSFTKELKKMLVAGAQPNISTSEIEFIIFNMPSSEKEQQKIAEFLSAIDASIEKVNEQIIQTQSFKKAMLQQMFV